MRHKVRVSPSTPLRHAGRAEVRLHSFLTSELHRGEWLARYPLSRRLGGPQSRSVRFVWRRESSLPPTGIRSPNRPARSVVAIPTTHLNPPPKNTLYIYIYIYIYIYNASRVHVNQTEIMLMCRGHCGVAEGYRNQNI